MPDLRRESLLAALVSTQFLESWLRIPFPNTGESSARWKLGDSPDETESCPRTESGAAGKPFEEPEPEASDASASRTVTGEITAYPRWLQNQCQGDSCLTQFASACHA